MRNKDDIYLERKLWQIGNILKVVLIVCLLVLFTRKAFAEPVSLDFKQATVPEVVQAMIREVLRRDYVIAPEVANLDKKISVQVRQVEKDKLLDLLGGVLKTVQVDITDRGGLLYIERSTPQAPAMVQPAQPAQPLPQPMSQGQMIAGQMQNGQFSPYLGMSGGMMQKIEVPEEIASYTPKGKPIEFLASVVRSAGCLVPDFKGKADKLVYSGSTKCMEKARQILEQVDNYPVSVLVRAVLVEFTTGQNESRSLSVALSALAGKLGIAFKAGTQLANAVTAKIGGLDAVLSAIEGDSRFRYVAEPTIRVNDGESAKFTVGNDVPTRGAVVSNGTGTTQQSIDYKTAGIVINLEPRVLDGMVTVKINQQMSSFALTTTSNIDSPTIYKREAQTTIAVKPGELVMLAGMDEERNSNSTSGLSFLPSFMKSKSEENARSQLVLLLEVKPQDI